MSYRGHIQGGVIVFDEATELPEGAEVRVTVVQKLPCDAPAGQVKTTLYERLKPFIGCMEGLPPDMSVNLDHYLYGAPKQQE